jgi:hypothetical protein
MTLGSITAGAGITADNVSPMNFIYVRNVGYGVRGAKEFLGVLRNASGGYGKAPETKVSSEDAKALLKQILETLSKELDDK